MDQNEVNNSINSDLIRGHIDTIILKALQAGDRYGYDIIKEIEHKSDGQYVIKQPTLYSCLKRLEVQGFVKSYWGSKSIGGRKKYFTLTDMGRELFIRNKNDWDYSRDVINKLISDDDYSAVSYPEEEQIETDLSADATETNIITEELTEETEQSEEKFVTEEISEETDKESDKEEDFEDEIDDEDQEDNEDWCDDEDENDLDDESNEDETMSDEEVLLSNECIIDGYETEDEACEVCDEDIEQISNEQPTDDFINEPIDDSAVSEKSTEENQEELFNETESPVEYAQQAEQAEIDESLPLSAAEQNHNNEDSNLLEEENSELLSRFYDEQTQESYISNVESAEYEPTQNDIIDVGNYFTDVSDESYEDEEEVASALAESALEDAQEEESDSPLPPPKFYPSRRIIRDFPEKEETVFYSYKRPMSEIDESSAVVDKEYRGVIARLISDNIVTSEPPTVSNDYATREYYQPEPKITQPQQQSAQTNIVKEPESQPALNEIETETGDKLDVRSHSHIAIKVYNNKHYYYANQLRLLQSGILFGVMLFEIVLSFYFIEVLNNGLNVTRLNLALYIAAVAVAASFPIASFFMASTNYYKRKRINYSGKSNSIFSIAVTLLLMLVIFFVNVYGGILIGDINNYLSSLIMPMVLSTNVIVNAIIFHLLYKSGKYNIEK